MPRGEKSTYTSLNIFHRGSLFIEQASLITTVGSWFTLLRSIFNIVPFVSAAAVFIAIYGAYYTLKLFLPEKPIQPSYRVLLSAAFSYVGILTFLAAHQVWGYLVPQAGNPTPFSMRIIVDLAIFSLIALLYSGPILVPLVFLNLGLLLWSNGSEKAWVRTHL